MGNNIYRDFDIPSEISETRKKMIISFIEQNMEHLNSRLRVAFGAKISSYSIKLEDLMGEYIVQ